MTPDTITDTPHHQQPTGARQHHGRRNAPGGRRWKRALLLIGAVATIASAAALIPAAGSSRNIDAIPTHTVARGDLVVTVTEQGVLASSDNKEIKCRVRGESTVTWVIESGTHVEPGDELVRLDTLAIEDAVNERSKYAHWSRSSAERSQANVVRAELAISEYLEGRYRTEMMNLEKNLAIAQSNERTAQNMLTHAQMMAERGYVSTLDVEDSTFARTRAELNVDVTKAQIEVLEQFTKAMELETLKGDLEATKARHAANVERAKMDAARRDLALEELGSCVMKAERAGLVIYPSLAAWKRAPEIEEGATVHRDQTLLLMPDLSKMQVKIGIHESLIERIRPGLPARVTLPDKTLEGEVSSVASVARPAGWWTGSVVKYDTIVKLPSASGLKPGMSADVEVVIHQHENVLTIPAFAVLDTWQGTFCWVRTNEGVNQRRTVQLGDIGDTSIVVTAGLKEGEGVVLDPLVFIEEAQMLALKPRVPADRETDHVD